MGRAMQKQPDPVGRGETSEHTRTAIADPLEGLSHAYMRWHRFRSNPSALIGGAIVTSVIILAIFAPWIAPFPEHAGDFIDFRNRHAAPSWAHWMGTDNVGRDVMSRVIFAFRISLTLVVVILGIAVPFGVTLGLIAGYFGGIVEIVIMRITDIALALPPLILALAVSAVLAPTLTNAMIALTLLWWNWHTRLIYSITRQLREEPFVEAARLMGASRRHILFRELLPNCVSAITVKTTLDAGFVILIGASLSFLGIGAEPPTPDLGTMVSSGGGYLPESWWESIMPGVAILYAILGFNLLGDGLRDLFDVEIS